MSTGTYICQRALQRIGAHSVVQPATPNTIDDAFEVLQGMIQEWGDQGIDLGIVPIVSVGNDISEPISARNPIINNLAILLAPDFDNGKNIVSPALLSAARSGYNRVKDLYQTITVQQKCPSSTLPAGAGNSQGINNRVFFGQDAELDG